MKILTVGANQSLDEFKSKFGANHSIVLKSSTDLTEADLVSADVVFDFDVDQISSHGHLYRKQPETILFINSVKTTLIEVVNTLEWELAVIGFNGLPGMFDRSLLELTSYRTDEEAIKRCCERLGTGFRLVKDRVGMVTPRVICMIINEAFFMVQEGTASEEDIDLAMKLGTNYPAGPFEMVASIGIGNIYQLLRAIYRDTGDERYKICPLLKRRYLESS